MTDAATAPGMQPAGTAPPSMQPTDTAAAGMEAADAPSSAVMPNGPKARSATDGSPGHKTGGDNDSSRGVGPADGDDPIRSPDPLQQPCTPAVARWIIRSALRAAREKAGMPQRVAGKKLDWSLSKVQRIEAGEASVSATDLTALLLMYGADRKQITHLDALARRARRRHGPWRDAVLCHLDSYTRELVQFEHDAAVIRWCESRWIPDPLHTDSYAAARLEHLATERAAELTAEQYAAHAAASRLRRDLFAGHAQRRPRYQVVLDESVIRRPYGRHSVLREQLEALLRQVRGGQLELCIVTHANANPLAAADPFILLDIDTDHHLGAADLADTTVLALHRGLPDGPHGPTLTTNAVLLAHYQLRWKKLWAASDPALAERALLRQLEEINTRWV